MPRLQDVGLYQISGPLLIGSFFAGIACVALRFRRSRGIERQQLKWFAAAVMTVLAVIVVVFAAYQATGDDYSDAIFLIGTSIIPVATGLAMLRYRLYEIDVIIRRTVVYAALIAALAALYLGGVALLGWIFRSVTGQSGALAVTLSTLLVAAAFQPLRPGSSARSITASIAASTTPQSRWTPSAVASASRSTWTRCRARCSAWSQRRSSQARLRCGCVRSNRRRRRRKSTDGIDLRRWGLEILPDPRLVLTGSSPGRVLLQ